MNIKISGGSRTFKRKWDQVHLMWCSQHIYMYEIQQGIEHIQERMRSTAPTKVLLTLNIRINKVSSTFENQRDRHLCLLTCCMTIKFSKGSNTFRKEQDHLQLQKHPNQRERSILRRSKYKFRRCKAKDRPCMKGQYTSRQKIDQKSKQVNLKINFAHRKRKI